MSMTSFVENILSRPGYDKFSRPGLDLGEYSRDICKTKHTVYDVHNFHSMANLED